MTPHRLYPRALDLLQALIQVPSFSGDEEATATLIIKWLNDLDIPTKHVKNNVWATNKYVDPEKPTLLLNSHHDTVKPNLGYTRDPFEAHIEADKLYGLGSNDAGGCLVALMTTFAHFYDRTDLKYNLILAASAEEEISGPNGLEKLLGHLPPITCAIVGEPTNMDLAIAEKGLLVIDAYAEGKAGHAAHAEPNDNAIYRALQDIAWIRTYAFPKTSPILGPVKMTVAQIQAGQQHNVVPETCHFVIDIRVNERYTNQEILAAITAHTQSRMVPRSLRLQASSIAQDHPLVQAGIKWGRTTYGSPTLSDQTFLRCPSLKMGPGSSTRSHQADEFIFLKELQEGIDLYIKILDEIL